MYLSNGCSAKQAPNFMKDHFKRTKLWGKTNLENFKTTDKELFYYSEYSSLTIPFESFPLEVKIHNNKRVNLDKWKSFISWQHFNK